MQTTTKVDIKADILNRMLIETKHKDLKAFKLNGLS